MPAVVLEVVSGIFPRPAAMRAAVPPVRSAVPALTVPALTWSAWTSTAQTGQGLGDRFGGVRVGGFAGFSGHALILHAT